MKKTSLKTFDYETKRAIYYECQEAHYPNLEVDFVSNFLKKEFDVIFVSLNHPYYKIKKPFLKKLNSEQRKRLYFIDCITRSIDNDVRSKDDVLFLSRQVSLTQISLQIRKYWKSFSKKKMVFIDSCELLLIKYNEREVFAFLHTTIQKLQKEGVVVCCFLKDSLRKEKEMLFKNLCDEVIYL